MRTNAAIAAQVAVEAVINGMNGYSLDTVKAVRQNGYDAGVHEMYMTMLEEAMTNHPDNY